MPKRHSWGGMCCSPSVITMTNSVLTTLNKVNDNAQKIFTVNKWRKRGCLGKKAELNLKNQRKSDECIAFNQKENNSQEAMCFEGKLRHDSISAILPYVYTCLIKRKANPKVKFPKLYLMMQKKTT